MLLMFILPCKPLFCNAFWICENFSCNCCYILLLLESCSGFDPAAKHKQGGASMYGKMSVLRQGRVLWYSGLPFPQTFQSYMEAQCEARQGHRGRKSQARLRMHSLPAQRQGHPRCVILILPETSSPFTASFFRFFPVVATLCVISIADTRPAPRRRGNSH